MDVKEWGKLSANLVSMGRARHIIGTGGIELIPVNPERVRRTSEMLAWQIQKEINEEREKRKPGREIDELIEHFVFNI